MAEGMVGLARTVRARVIADDVHYPNEPFFNDGVLARTVDEVAMTYDTVYLAAAGNWGNRGWEANFRSAWAGSFPGPAFDFDPGANVDTLQNFTLAPGQTLDMVLQWDNAFLEGGSDLPNFQVKTDLDVWITDANGNMLRRFADLNVNTGEAYLVRATVFDGSFHPVDSNELSFKMAGSLAFKDAMTRARPTILEPVMNVEVYAPSDFAGDLMGDLNGRRGRIAGMDTRGASTVIRAKVPMSEMLTYEQHLTSATGGRGSYHMEFSHYEEVPAHLHGKIISAAKAERGQEAAEEV